MLVVRRTSIFCSCCSLVLIGTESRIKWLIVMLLHGIIQYFGADWLSDICELPHYDCGKVVSNCAVGSAHSLTRGAWIG